MTKDEALKKAFKQAFQLGQDYWYQADHEYVSQNKKSDVTRAKFEQLMEDAIKEALAQPEQTNTRPYYTIDELNEWADEKEKQAWRNAAIRIGEELSSVGPDGYYDMDAWKWLDWAMEQEPRGKNSLAQPEQEPVAWIHNFIEGGISIGKRPADLNRHPDRWTALYKDPKPCPTCEALARTVMLDQTSHDTTPPQRTWVGLTEEDLKLLSAEWRIVYGAWMDDFARDIEAKLKEKNT